MGQMVRPDGPGGQHARSGGARLEGVTAHDAGPWPPRSAYLHLPFCHRRCFYCDFAVVPLGERADGAAPAPGSASIAAYLCLLEREIAAAGPGPALSTVYFGGGTPSLLTPAQVGVLLAALRRRFGLAPGAEISLELDPASFDRPRLEGYLAAGVNRVSLGGQSFDDAVLASLGRRHRGVDVEAAAGWLRQAQRDGGLRSWSLDLIQGLPLPPGATDGDPRQRRCHWSGQLERALALGAPHLSIYDLSIEPGTVFAWRLGRGELQLPDQDLAADLLELSWRRLAAAGYGHYEVSNFALPGHASRHNRVYWSGAGWWGFGLGATSAPWGERQARPRQREAYARWLVEAEAETGAPAAGGMPLDELLLVGLRRREGVALEALLAAATAPGREPVTELLADLRRRLQAPLARGLLVEEGPRWRFSDPAGLALSNPVLRELLGWWQERQEAMVPPVDSTAPPGAAA